VRGNAPTEIFISNFTLSAQLKLGGSGSTLLVPIYESPGRKNLRIDDDEDQLKMNPDDPSLHFELGLLLWEAGEESEETKLRGKNFLAHYLFDVLLLRGVLEPFDRGRETFDLASNCSKIQSGCGALHGLIKPQGSDTGDTNQRGVVPLALRHYGLLGFNGVEVLAQQDGGIHVKIHVKIVGWRRFVQSFAGADVSRMRVFYQPKYALIISRKSSFEFVKMKKEIDLSFLIHRNCGGMLEGKASESEDDNEIVNAVEEETDEEDNTFFYTQVFHHITVEPLFPLFSFIIVGGNVHLITIKESWVPKWAASLMAEKLTIGDVAHKVFGETCEITIQPQQPSKLISHVLVIFADYKSLKVHDNSTIDESTFQFSGITDSFTLQKEQLTKLSARSSIT